MLINSFYQRDTADRNFSLAYFMRENRCFPPGDVKINDALDFYFQVRILPTIGQFVPSPFSKQCRGHGSDYFPGKGRGEKARRDS